MDDPRSFERLTRAAERIAGALEVLVRNATSSGPVPDLRVRRPDCTATSPASANARPADGTLSVHMVNAGAAATTIRRPVVRIGDRELDGTVLGPDSRSRETYELTPGATCVLTFELGAGQMTEPQLPIELRVLHSPGLFPRDSEVVAELEPVGDVAGRRGWEAATTRVEIAEHGAG